jgi:hypothetical protein
MQSLEKSNAILKQKLIKKEKQVNPQKGKE